MANFNQHTPGYRLPTETGGWAFECKNDADEPIPPFSVVEATGFEQPEPGRIVLKVKQSSGYGAQYKHYITGPTEIATGSYGLCSRAAVRAAYDTSDGTPLPGENWGPVEDDWKLRKESGGFKVLGKFDSGDIWVAPAPMLDVRCVLDEALADGDSAEATVHTKTGATSYTIEVHDVLPMDSGMELVSGTGILARWFEDWGKWVAMAATACPTEEEEA